jgi:hypothetical protein
MIARSAYHWVWVALLIACYLAICARTAFRMAKSGRSFWLWLVLSVFLTSIPGTFILMRDQIRNLPPRRRGPRGGERAEAGQVRCSRCGRLFGPEDVDRSGGAAVCPHCGLPVDETELA